jgi:hypothetical protein
VSVVANRRAVQVPLTASVYNLWRQLATFIPGTSKMKILRVAILAALPALSLSAIAGDLTTDAAIGGALGGAVGGAVGAEVGGRQGAIVGAGVGAAAGTAINTKGYQEPRRRDYDDREYRRHHHDDDYDDDHHRGHFCPPGQAKKGNC